MSAAGLEWAATQRVGSSSMKLLLFVLGDFENSMSGDIFPSIERLVQRTELNRKTVMDARRRLIEMGLLIDTGRRVGQRKLIPVYRLAREREESRIFQQEAQFRTGEESRNRDTYPLERPDPSEQESPPTPQGGEGEADLFGETIVVTTADHVLDRASDLLVEGWNGIAARRPRLPATTGIDERQRKRLAKVLLEAKADRSVEAARVFVGNLLDKVDNSPFLCGEVKAWSASMDWIINPANVKKTMERRNERELASNDSPFGSGSSAVRAGQRALEMLRAGRERSGARGGAASD